MALILYLLDTLERHTTFGELYQLSKQFEFDEWLEQLLEETTNYDPEFYRNASSYLNTAEKTRTSILKTFTGYLELFANPIINAATSDSDFDLRNVRNEKTTIYIGFADNEKEMISPLLTIFWQQLINFMTQEIPKKEKEPYQLLCLMDKFSTLGRLANLKNALKILRGYHVRVVIIIQYLAQMLEIYSKAEAEAFKNIKTKVIFGLDIQEDAHYVSQTLGIQTKDIINHTYAQNNNTTTTPKNQTTQAVPLMRPEAIQQMKQKQAIIMCTAHPPIMAKQYRWYEENLLKRLPCGKKDVPFQKAIIGPFQMPLDKIGESTE